MRLRAVVPVVLLLFLCAARADAQFDTGRIAGLVRDESNAPIPGASVTVENEGNRDRRTAVTDSTGFYAVPDLPVGSYTIIVELSGFKRFVKTAIKVSAAAQLGVDVQLEVGRLEETVEVKASSATVQTETAQVARTVDSRRWRRCRARRTSDDSGPARASESRHSDPPSPPPQSRRL